MTLQDYIDEKDFFNKCSVELCEIPGKEFECGFATGIAVLLGDITKKRGGSPNKQSGIEENLTFTESELETGS